MTQERLHQTTEMRSIEENSGVFIGPLIPFVGLKYPFIEPSVGSNIPLVKNRGITLIELLTALIITGVLAAVAVPSMQKFISSNRLTAQVNDLLADINLARTEAIKRNTAAGVCVTASGGTSCVTSGNWANGWMVYAVVSGTDTPIRTHESLTGKNTLTGPGDVVIYGKSGVMSSAIGSFTLCDPVMKITRTVTLNVTGRPNLSAGTC